MMIQFDSHIMAIQPESLQWHPPQEIAKDGSYAPIRGQYWSANFSLSKVTVASIQDWYDIFTAGTHTANLPHPRTLAMTNFTCYVNDYSVRMNTEGDCPYVAGLDVELSGITL
jgi:hypothetical protein